MKWAAIKTQPTAELSPVNAVIREAFAALSEREALRLFKRLSDRFSYSRGHDAIFEAVQEIARMPPRQRVSTATIAPSAI